MDREVSRGTVLIVARAHPVLAEELSAMGFEPKVREHISREAAMEELRHCVGIVTANNLAIDSALIAAAPMLQFIGRLGSGLEIIDQEAAAARGIHVLSSPEGNSNAVGEHTLGLLLALTKKIAWSSGEVANGLWLREENRGYELEGRTVGIIGYGHTGNAFANKLAGMGVQVLAYDPKPGVVAQQPYTRLCSLEEVQQQAEVLSFHVPLLPETRGYFNLRFLNALQQECWLLNTSRGQVVALGAVLAGLESGKLLGAALDVLPAEPLDRLEEAARQQVAALCARPDVLITPHIAGYSYEAIYKMSRTLADKLRVILVS